jgi:DNA-binding NarL/FixJ family response regulator
MELTKEQISKTFELMQERSDAPKLTPEQLNAVDLLILGKTDKEVSETIGVRRETVTRWHKNAFFIAELNARRGVMGRIEAQVKGCSP